MRILVVLGGSLAGGGLAKAYTEAAPALFQQGCDKQGTRFAGHEISVVLPEEAINTCFEQKPDRLVFLGTLVDSKKKGAPAFVLAQRMLTRNMDKKKFLFTNPLSIPPFNKEENFFRITDMEEMAEWLGL